ncbi:MAG: (d)CMP kinase [Actinomycetota bacterium]
MGTGSALSGIVIAIDGPAGSGKSTLARRLAQALGLPYINTGLMYRALTLAALRGGVHPGDGSALARLTANLRFAVSSTTTPPSLEIDGRPPSVELTTQEVERTVSQVSRHPEVRSLMRTAQRRLGEAGAVMEGRDIGSVIFTDAALKIFLVASPSVRAARRVLQRRSEEPGTLPERELREVAGQLAARDVHDARVNPLVPAADAVRLDTTGRDEDEIFEEAIALARERIGGYR